MTHIKKKLISKKAITQAQTIAIAVIIIIGVIAAAWYATRPGPTPTPTPTPTPKPTPTPTPKPTPTPTPKPTPTPPAETILIVTQVGTHMYTEPFGPDAQFFACGGYPDVFVMAESLFAFEPYELQKGKVKVVPWLAKSYSISEDGLTYTIDIRKGVTFHGTGDEMTIEDVVWSLERSFLHEFPADLIAGQLPCRYVMAPESIEKVDSDTLKIQLSAPNPTFLETLAQIYTAIMDKDACMEHAKIGEGGKSDWGFSWLNSVPDPGKDPYTGPYTIGRFDLQERYEDVRYDDWWGGPPEYGLTNENVDRIINVVTMQDIDARFKLEKGDVDICADLLPDTWAAFEDRAGYKTTLTPSCGGFTIDMHCLSGPLQDWRVRKAIKMILNYTAINEDIMLGTSTICQGTCTIMAAWTPETGMYYGDGMNPDIEGAKALLAEAGYPDGFELNLYLRPEPRSGQDFTDFALQIQTDVAKIGITCKMNIYKPSQYYALKRDPAIEGAWIQPCGYISQTEPMRFLNDQLGWPYTGQEPGQAITRDQYFGFNQTSQGDTFDFDWFYETYDKALNTVDFDERQEIWRELWIYYLERGPNVMMDQNSVRTAYSDNVKGFFWSAYQIWPSILMPDFSVER